MIYNFILLAGIERNELPLQPLSAGVVRSLPCHFSQKSHVALFTVERKG